MTSPAPKLAGAGRAITFDSYACRYLEEHISYMYPRGGADQGRPLPEKTTWWKGGEFSKLMFPSFAKRLEDGRIFLNNGNLDLLWLRLPTGRVMRPPKGMQGPILVSPPTATHRFQNHRASIDILKTWGLPVPTLQDFIAAVRPIVRKVHTQKLAQAKADDLNWFVRRVVRERLEQEEIKRVGRLPITFSESWYPWDRWVYSQLDKPTPEDKARARMRQREEEKTEKAGRNPGRT